MSSPKLRTPVFLVILFLAPAVEADRVLEFSLAEVAQQQDVQLEAVRRAAIMRGWDLVEEGEDTLVLEITTDFRQRYARIRLQLAEDKMTVTLLDHKNLGKRKVSKDFDRWIELLHSDTLAWIEYIRPMAVD